MLPDRRFFIIENKKRRYFRHVDDARAAYLATQSRHLTLVERAELMAKAEIRRAAAYEKLEHLGLADLPNEGNLPDGPPKPWGVRGDDTVVLRHLETAHALADMLDIPQMDVRRVGHNDARKASAPALSKLLAEWRRLKMVGRRAGISKVRTAYSGGS